MKKANKKEFETKVIDEALEDIAIGSVHSHQDVMEETKKRFPHLFNRYTQPK